MAEICWTLVIDFRDICVKKGVNSENLFANYKMPVFSIKTKHYGFNLLKVWVFTFFN